MNPTASDVFDLQKRTKAGGITIGEFKRVCREFRDKFGLTDRQALDLARNENVVEIMAALERRSEDAPERAASTDERYETPVTFEMAKAEWDAQERAGKDGRDG